MDGPDQEQNTATRSIELYQAALQRSERRVAAFERYFGRKRYALRQWDRMRTRRFNPVFLFPQDMPVGLKVLIVLPHHHEAAKLAGITLTLLARDESGHPRNNVHAVVVNPSHRGISAAPHFAKREDMIDAVKKEALDWAHVIGLELGLPAQDRPGRTKLSTLSLPSETDYACKRAGDQFVYGPDGAYRFFNAWRTYDSGQDDPNQQVVDPKDQCEFNALIREEQPDLVLLPDCMDPHPSHWTTRQLTMEALRVFLAELDRAGEKRGIALLEYASLQLLTPPRYNLWAVVPKTLARLKNEANKVFHLQQQHNVEMYQMLSERVVSMAASDEFNFTVSHPEKSGFAGRLSQNAPGHLPANITAECFTVSDLSVRIKRGIHVIQETRAAQPGTFLQSLSPRISIA